MCQKSYFRNVISKISESLFRKVSSTWNSDVILISGSAWSKSLEKNQN